VQPPTFPNNTCTITDPAYGGVGDGKTDNTTAFQKAIADCEMKGGGRVDVPAGNYSTGAIHLDNNIELHLEMGATLLFNGTLAEYPMVLTRYQGTEQMNHSPMIYAYNKTNIGVTGPGVLDATATGAWNGSSGNRTNFVEPYLCTNVYFQGITLKGAHFWQFHPTLSTNVLADTVTTTDSGFPNNDGFDPESCTNVVLTNSTIQSHDDAMAIKSGRGPTCCTLTNMHVPTSNFVFMHSSFSSSWGLMTLGSELSDGIHDVYGYDLKTTGPGVSYVFEIKGNTSRGGTVKDIYMDTVNMAGVKKGIMWCDMLYMGQTGNLIPDYSNFGLSHAMISGAPSVLDLSNTNAMSTIKNVTMSDSTYTSIGNTATPAPNTMVTWTNVTINGMAK
jgi:polygalacturonase